MYFPFLRGKQNELLALRECSDKLTTSKKIIPIIEPVTKGSNPLFSCLKCLNDKNINHIVVYNSFNGHFSKKPSEMKKLASEILKKSPSTEFAYIVTNNTTTTEIHEFLKEIQNRKFSFIHLATYENPSLLISFSALDNFRYHIFTESAVSRKYKKQFSSFNCVAIKNNFREVKKNAEYSDPDHEFYTDDHLNFSDDGLFGFGDYTILPEKFKEGGFQPYTAALHLTHEERDDNEIWVKHFLSEVYDYPTSDQAKLIHEALPDLVAFVEKNKPYFDFSTAVSEYIKIHNEGRVTNLGLTKKLSIKHHLELMVEVLK